MIFEVKGDRVLIKGLEMIGWYTTKSYHKRISTLKHLAEQDT